jgi:spore germination protein YaaH
MTRRPIVAGIVVALVAVTVGTAALAPRSDDGRGAVDPGVGAAGTPRPPTPPPVPGHEVYGFVPYWEMDDGIADHLAATDLSTIGLFSVTHRPDGSLATDQNGFRRITGPVGRRLITEARDRGTRTELVYTSFGAAKNDAIFGDPVVRERTITELVRLAGELGVDGINVDIEGLPVQHIPAYGAFVGSLRSALREASPEAQVSVATTANQRGAAMGLAASLAGADRIFMMGYDYRVPRSEPGALAPLGRRDGSEKTLAWSLDLYRDAGVPLDRTLLGLPLYGVVWPVGGPEVGAPSTGRGDVWVPRRNLAALDSPLALRAYDSVEDVEVLSLADGAAWQSVYYDTPASLMPKLGLADARGLAGAGFWAVGYERGLPEYTDLIEAFRNGRLADAP